MSTNPRHDDGAEPVESWDEALGRLEDFLLAYPFDRALPDLSTILREARIPADFLRHDDRALKVLHEAIVARPLSSADHVAQVRTEVELLTMEVHVLTERLASPQTRGDEIARAKVRLAQVRRKLEEIRGVL